jgi:multimeric flavodoxin WrbA
VHILGVVGSPRRNGNTHILVSNLLEGAREAGATTELVLLRDLRIQECDGCHTCWKGKPCSKDDDMNDLFPKIADSDVVVFGTPVYWHGPTALMKAFLDRFVYFNSPENRAKIVGKSAVLVAPFEEEDVEAAAPLVAMFEKSLDYLEMPLASKILVPGVGAKGDVLRRPNRLAECYELGRGLALGHSESEATIGTNP